MACPDLFDWIKSAGPAARPCVKGGVVAASSWRITANGVVRILSEVDAISLVTGEWISRQGLALLPGVALTLSQAAVATAEHPLTGLESVFPRKGDTPSIAAIVI